MKGAVARGAMAIGWGLALASCDPATLEWPDDGPDEPPEVVAPAGWRLTWRDEFDGAAGTPVDATRWVHDVGGHGWGNGQLEFDTDRVDNVRHDGEGHLAIVARREDFGGNAYTSGRIKTEGRFAQAYGRFEARIRLPVGQGIWPAFWLLGADIGAVGWPGCGEIDVMEFRGQTPRESTGALHGPGYSGGEALWAARQSAAPLPDDFHVFAVEWDPHQIVWMVDGEVFQRRAPAGLPAGAQWVFDHPFFVILNVAVGGSFLGPPDASTVFPQTMLVDYVRVFERDPPLEPPAPPAGLAAPYGVDGPFVASGYMGDGAAGGVAAVECPRRGAVDAAGACHGFRWTPGGDGWAGVYWQSPANNWGALPGQPIPPGAREIDFVAWGAAGGEAVRFMAGYADSDGFAVQRDVVLDAAPRRYTLSLAGVDYDDVRAGFGWVAERGGPLTFYVDDITWR